MESIQYKYYRLQKSDLYNSLKLICYSILCLQKTTLYVVSYLHNSTTIKLERTYAFTTKHFRNGDGEVNLDDSLTHLYNNAKL